MLLAPPPLPKPRSSFLDEEITGAALRAGGSESSCAEPWVVATVAATHWNAIQEQELLDQVARVTASLQVAHGRLAAIHAGIEGIEAALAALSVGSGVPCPSCRSGEIRSVLARLRAMAEAI